MKNMSDPYHILTLTILLGALGLWLMLPRGTARGRGVGIVMASVALGLGASQVPRLSDWMADSVFAVLAAVTVVSAAGAVTFRNPLYCAIWFGQSLLGVAGLFLFTGAQFLAVATVVVYAGAILVTFLFVLMLAQPEGKAPYDRVSWEALISAATGVVIIGVLSMTIGRVLSPATSAAPPITVPSAEALSDGVLASEHVARLGGELFGRHLIAVEVAGVLLLVAVVGAAAIVAHKKPETER
jgi:NADH-quinone oxidoreductase subunit J